MRILVFGDSITQGFDDTEKGGWVNRLFVDLSAREGGQDRDDFHYVFNLGISGDTTTALLRRIESEIMPRLGDDPALIILDIGGNDACRNLKTNECEVPLETFSDNYQKILEVAQKYGKVVCLGLHDSDEAALNPIPWEPTFGLLDKDKDLYDETIKTLANEHDALYISMADILSSNFAVTTYDGDHPSAEGHRLIYERVKSELLVNGIL